MSKIVKIVLTPISDQGNAALSKAATYLGVSGSSVGIASGVAEATSKTSDPTFLTLAEWGSVCGIVGGITLAIKAMTDIYFAIKKNQREEEVHERRKTIRRECDK